VLVDEGRFVHGGNFHGDYVSAAVDQLKAAVVKLTMLSERRINFYLHASINKILPPFANLGTPGFNLGLQGMQFVATSTTAQSQTLAYPQHLHSIPTNGDNQDVVSLGTDAALIAKRVVDNAWIVTTIEAIVLAQAVDCLNIAGDLCVATRTLYETVRADVPPVTHDRPMQREIEALLCRLSAADNVHATAVAEASLS
jgi:histidine ammonia-lyase